MGANIKYNGSTIALLGEGEEATLHTQNTILTGDIEVYVDKGQGQSVVTQLPWSNISNIPSYLSSESSLKTFIGQQVPNYESDPTISSWAKAKQKPFYTYAEIGGTFPGVKTAELESRVESQINSTIGTKVPDEVRTQLSKLTYGDIGMTGFPGITVETDPTVPAWAKAEKLIYSTIEGRLELGITKDTAYRGSDGAALAYKVSSINAQVTNIISDVAIVKSDIVTINTNIATINTSLEEKVTESNVNSLITSALAEGGSIDSAIDVKIAGLTPGGEGGVSEQTVQMLIDNSFNQIHDWAKAENKPTYKYSEITELPELLELGETKDTAYHGDKGKKNTEDIGVLMAWKDNFSLSDSTLYVKELSIQKTSNDKQEFSIGEEGVFTITGSDGTIKKFRFDYASGYEYQENPSGEGAEDILDNENILSNKHDIINTINGTLGVRIASCETNVSNLQESENSIKDRLKRLEESSSGGGASSSEIQEKVELLESIVEQCASIAYVQGEDSRLQTQINALPTTAYVNEQDSKLQTSIDGLPTKSDLSNACGGLQTQINALPTTAYVDERDGVLQGNIDTLASSVSGQIDSATENLATKNEVSEAIKNFTTKEYVDNKYDELQDQIDNLNIPDQNAIDERVSQGISAAIPGIKTNIMADAVAKTAYETDKTTFSQSVSTLDTKLNVYISASSTAIDSKAAQSEVDGLKISKADQSEVDDLKTAINTMSAEIQALLARIQALEGGDQGSLETPEGTDPPEGTN